MITHLTDLERVLENEARLFAGRADTGERCAVQRFCVLDAEYRYDSDMHAAYRTGEGAEAEAKIRWPFHRLAALAWCVLRIEPGAAVPVVEEVRVLTREDASESAMASELFALLARAPDMVAVTWGGECKDLAVLRQLAANAGLVLPVQLADLSPLSRWRLDLCNALAVRAESVHLPEYAAASSIPAKPSPSKAIGQLVALGSWEAVREQVLADVATTAVILLRHLASHGLAAIAPPPSTLALAEALGQAQPGSAFVRRTLLPWARGVEARGKLSCPVYRAA